MLGSIIRWFIATSAVSSIGSLLFSETFFEHIKWYLVLLVLAVAGKVALKAGWDRSVGWTLVIGLQLMLVAASFHSGGLSSSALGAWPATVVLAAVTLGWRESLFAASTGMLAAVHFYSLEANGWRAPLAVNPVDRVLTLGGILFTIAIWTGLAVRWLAQALYDANAQRERAELALRERDQELELRKKAEADLKSAVLNARAASEAKSKFLANMSHELRTPLNAIIGYAEILMEEADPCADTTDLGRIRASGRHLLGLINDVLDLSKIEAGHLKLIPEDLDMESLVAELEHSSRALAQATNNQLIIDVPHTLGRVFGDPMRVRQVLLNLLSNAFKFTKNGTVRLEVRRENSANGACILFAVHDTGIGISEEQLSRLFRAFVQADDTTNRRFGGTGLGLALSQRLAQMMEGDITVASVVGEGSTFTFTLPIYTSRNEVIRLTNERLREAKSGKLPAVLCVDDDPEALLLLDRLLTAERLCMVPCLDPARALAIAADLQPIAVTIDLHMPGVDGAELIDSLRANPATAHLPAMVVTVDDDGGKAVALGIQHWLTKPVDRNTLIRAIAAVEGVGSGPVLVVEDDPSTQDVLVRTLEHQGIRAVAARNGRHALERLNRESLHPKLILLDLMMPEMDGFTLAEHLRADPSRANIPIVVLTAATLDEHHRTRLASCVGILQKGTETMSALVDTLRQLAHRQRNAA